jgi:DNA invertase Pin-like site-specific DNA recombinase
LQKSGLSDAFSRGGYQELLAGVEKGREGVLLNKKGSELLRVYVICSFVAKVKTLQDAIHDRALLYGRTLID